ncbi:hypothetical protein I9W82_002191 [Candida metapsilosis]|uniref:Uncharacterized protein n=1 Tax=Candida metapsilosis TaxID=273372 RepID=A0A8H7ZEE5_9ASCO|nr:hypothetical protein I9W82_002191 [Candida metapsilosis]
MKIITVPLVPQSQSTESTNPDAISTATAYGSISIESERTEQETVRYKSMANSSDNTGSPSVTPTPLNNDILDDYDDDDYDDDDEFYSLDPNQIEDIDPFSLDLSLNVFAQEHSEYDFEFESSNAEDKSKQTDFSLDAESCRIVCELEVGDIPNVNFDLLDFAIDSLNSQISYLSVEKKCYDLLIDIQRRRISDLKERVKSLGDHILAPILDDLSSGESDK